jgi:hypothetical protein
MRDTFPWMRFAQTMWAAASFRRPFIPRKWPGWATVALGLSERLLPWEDRVRFFYDVVREMGGDIGTVASLIESSIFSVVLVLAGLAYVIFVGEPEKGVQRHPWWPYIGWSVFGLCFTAMIVTAGYGAIEIYVRTQIDKGIALNSRDRIVPAPDRPQAPVYTDARGLTPNQIRILSNEADKIKSLIPNLRITTPPRDNEPYVYRRQFDELFTRVGINVAYGDETPRGLDEEGVMIAAKDVNNLSKPAQKVREMFELASIPTKIISLPSTFDGQDFGLGFVLFIGPRPRL